jgi:SH3-like domain-containing protein
MRLITSAAFLCASSILAFSAHNSYRQKPVTAPINTCSVAAYVVDPDPQGLNVRSGPGKEFNIIGKLPNAKQNDVAVNISGSTGRWVEIDNAEIAEEGNPLTRGKGWVFGPLLSTRATLRAYADTGDATPRVKVYSEPVRKSAVSAKLPVDTEVKIIGCKGGWVQIQFKVIEGWLDPESQCANTLTTCS